MKIKDAKTMTKIEIDKIEKELVKEINKITDEACNNANLLLNTYGLTAKMQLLLERK